MTTVLLVAGAFAVLAVHLLREWMHRVNKDINRHFGDTE